MTEQREASGAMVPIAVTTVAALAWAGSAGGKTVGAVPVFALCMAIAVAVQWIAFVPSYLKRTERYFDLTGSLTYLSFTALAIWLSQPADERAILLAGLVGVWAARLGTFLFSRIVADGSDARFDHIKTSFTGFLSAWSLQGMWICFTAGAALAAITAIRSVPLSWIAWTGLAIWIIGFGIEVVADRQKRAFREQPENEGRFIDSGLWAWSRHPNYFGEIVLWTGVAIIAAPALTGWQYVTLSSPVFVTLLLTRGSGIPLLEERADAKWGGEPEYEEYKRSTPVLVPRMPRGVLSVALAASIVACGAESDSSARPSATVRDSAGVTIVENARLSEADRVGWTISDQPITSIGSLDGDERYQLYQVVDATVLADDRIAIANRGTLEIRFYDSDGQYLAAVGGEGEGPGEFTALSHVANWRADSIIAWDFRQRRATVFDSEPSYGRTFPIASGDSMGVAEFVEVAANDRLLIRGGFLFGDDDLQAGLQRLTRPYGLAGPDGEVIVSLGDHPGAETNVVMDADFVAVAGHPFARQTLDAVWGELVIISPSDRYELNAYDGSGSLVRSVRMDYPLVTVTDEHLSTFIEHRAQQTDEELRPRVRADLSDLPLTETFPAFGDLLVDAADHIWVQDYVAPPGESLRWTIFDPQGAILGWIDLPAGLELVEVGSDYLLVTVTDEFDVEYVQLWGLERP